MKLDRLILSTSFLRSRAKLTARDIKRLPYVASREARAHNVQN